MKEVVAFDVSLNKQNYSRYGSCYVNTIKNLDDTHLV